MTALLTTADGVPLMQRLAQQRRRRQLKAVLLVVPLLLFLLVTFLLPIAALLGKSVDNPEVVTSLPQTLSALQGWDGKTVPAEPVYRALVADLAQARAQQSVPELAKRLNMERSGFRTMVQKIARRLPLVAEPGQGMRDAVIALDERWGEPTYWQVIARNDRALTPYYLLSALDMRQGADGTPQLKPADERAFLAIFGRTLWMSFWVTAWCLLLGYPLAYWLAQLPARKSNLLMILVLLPFWTSVLVRVAAWIVLLQREGLINGALISSGLIDAPLALAFNRLGVYIAMVHILLPFVILPAYSVMKSIPPSYVRAAISLGDHPFAAFWKIYFPQTVSGVAAGALLVFIMCIGYYITPALLGSPDEQMVSYYVAFYTNVTINWGMAAALGSLLLVATLLLYGVYSRLVGSDKLSLG